MFAVNAIDIHNRLTSGPVEAHVFGQYIEVVAVTMMGTEHVILHFKGGNVVKRNEDLVAVRDIDRPAVDDMTEMQFHAG